MRIYLSSNFCAVFQPRGSSIFLLAADAPDSQNCKRRGKIARVRSVSMGEFARFAFGLAACHHRYMAAFCLTIHARYQCRHAGACCRNWTVPAESHVVQLVERRGLRRAGVNGPLFVSSRKPDFTGAMDVARDKNGCCVFFERADGGSCVIHRHAGVQALPSACRHFPRQFLRDGRGTFVSLSHFCPTAASMLDDAEPLAIVNAAPPLMLEEPVEGLDGRDALPPLLRPGILCDLPGYDAWERAAVAVLERSDLTWRQALDRIAAATERVRTWKPGAESLTSHVAAAFEEGMRDATPPSVPEQELLNVLSRLTTGRMSRIDGIEDFEARWRESVGDAFDCHDRAMKNYVAARVFGNWMAYQGRGLRSIVQWARAAAALVRHHALRRALDARRPPTPDAFIEAVRMSDLVLLHGIDTQAFAHAVAPLEGPA